MYMQLKRLPDDHIGKSRSSGFGLMDSILYTYCKVIIWASVNLDEISTMSNCTALEILVGQTAQLRESKCVFLLLFIYVACGPGDVSKTTSKLPDS